MENKRKQIAAVIFFYPVWLWLDVAEGGIRCIDGKLLMLREKIIEEL